MIKNILINLLQVIFLIKQHAILSTFWNHKFCLLNISMFVFLIEIKLVIFSTFTNYYITILLENAIEFDILHIE